MKAVMNVPDRPQRPRATPLRELAELISVSPVVGDTVITGITLASSRVRPGDLYVAAPGARTHGARFAADAVAAGARAVLTDAAGAEICADADVTVPILVVDSPRATLGRLAPAVHGHPGQQLDLLAVTGTQGKTTTTRLLEGALTTSGVNAAVIGTVGTRINGIDVPSALTTPEAPDLHGLFAAMVEQQVQVCAMEVSSHALVLGRVDGVVFDAAAFLNLGRDHLDFHSDVDDYFAAKASLFTPERTRVGLTNVDDEYGRRLLDLATVPMQTFSTHGADADWRAVDIEPETTGSRFTVLGPDGLRLTTRVGLVGDFNVANALCAIALAALGGIDPALVAEGLIDGPGVPGRLESVDEGQDYLAVVDYAHKPDAVQAALDAVRQLTTGRVILVLGAGGDRDRGKREVMGELGARLADVFIVSDDNPRSEDPAAIRAAIIEGARRVAEAERAEVIEVGDRHQAIADAVALAGPGDAVVIAGKGHETGQEVDGVVHPFDDRDVLRAELRRREGR